MIHPIPPGTRDILPDEMRELRRLQWTLLEAFGQRGYGEVLTPAIEYDEVMARGEGRTARAAYRFFDERGERRFASATSPTPTGRCARSAGRCVNSPRPASS